MSQILPNKILKNFVLPIAREPIALIARPSTFFVFNKYNLTFTAGVSRLADQPWMDPFFETISPYGLKKKLLTKGTYLMVPFHLTFLLIFQKIISVNRDSRFFSSKTITFELINIYVHKEHRVTRGTKRLPR